MPNNRPCHLQLPAVVDDSGVSEDFADFSAKSKMREQIGRRFSRSPDVPSRTTCRLPLTADESWSTGSISPFF
jgi:hypothetical protein